MQSYKNNQRPGSAEGCFYILYEKLKACSKPGFIIILFILVCSGITHQLLMESYCDNTAVHRCTDEPVLSFIAREWRPVPISVICPILSSLHTRGGSSCHREPTHTRVKKTTSLHGSLLTCCCENPKTWVVFFVWLFIIYCCGKSTQQTLGGR